MQGKLSLEELVRSGVPCSSFSFCSAFKQNDRHQEIPCWGQDAASTSDVVETREERLGRIPKRRGQVADGLSEMKRMKADFELVNVSRGSLFLVGRLQLWNKSTASHLHASSITLDCLAFSDGEITICCSIPSLDTQLLGQLVQVTAWTFLPIFHSLDARMCGAGGCLEIHSLKLLDSATPVSQVSSFPSLCLSPAAANVRNGLLESPLDKQGSSRPRLRLWGSLHCISPTFALPSKSSTLGEQSETQSMLGFLVELHACSHETNCNTNTIDLQSSISSLTRQEIGGPSFEQVVPIYFSGAVAAWRPVLGGMLGDCVAISGLRRKMIRVGSERKEFCLFVATCTSLVSRFGPPQGQLKDEREGQLPLCNQIAANHVTRFTLQNDEPGMTELKDMRYHTKARLSHRCEPAEDKKQGLGSYIGIVTDILMGGQLVELDDKVWLLLTHYKLTHVHGLRVGAMIAMRHVHLVTLKNVSEKALLLGACLRSHVWVVLHSIFTDMPSFSEANLRSRLSKSMESLPFAMAFWVLQVIISLRCKLRGLYTDEELLGSKKVLFGLLISYCALLARIQRAGIISRNLRIILASPLTLHRDVFKEFFMHEDLCHLGHKSEAPASFKVPPLSNFCEHVESLWHDPDSLVWQGENMEDIAFEDSKTRTARSNMPRSASQTQYMRQIISSAELGIVLIGSLEVCQYTGKLRLVDSTGAIDAVVPDLQSVSNFHCVYMIVQFKLILEGQVVTRQSGTEKGESTTDSSLLWSKLLKGVVLKYTPSGLVSYYVQFHLQQASCLDGLRWPSAEQDSKRDIPRTCDTQKFSEEVWKGKEFNIALITHKYPARRKYTPEQAKECQWTMYVEAILLPYHLFIHQGGSNILSESGVQERVNVPDCIEDTKSLRHDFKEKCEEKCGSNAMDVNLKKRRCIVQCHICCFSQQRFGDKQNGRHLLTPLPALLMMRESSIISSESSRQNLSCATTEGQCNHKQVEGKVERILLTLNWRSVEYSQVLRIGDWYLLPILHSQQLLHNPGGLTDQSRIFVVDYRHPILSIHWNLQEDSLVSQSVRKSISVSMASTASQRSPRNFLLDRAVPATIGSRDSRCGAKRLCSFERWFCGGRCGQTLETLEEEYTYLQNSQLVDVVITLASSGGEAFRNWLAAFRAQVVPPLLDVGETLEHAPHSPRALAGNFTMPGKSLLTLSNAVKRETPSGIFSLQGEVVSVQGKIETMKYFDPPGLCGEGQLKQTSTNLSLRARLEEKILLLGLQDLHSSQLINVQMNFDKYIQPLGLGPGAVVSLYRILLKRGEDVQLQSIPTTLVIINSVEERFSLPSDSEIRCLNRNTEYPRQEQQSLSEIVSKIDLLHDFISHEIPGRDHLRVHCKVVSVQVLELQWEDNTLPQSALRNFQSSSYLQGDLVGVAVSSGCFTIDDGSAVAECWARGKEAAKILGFPELISGMSTQCPPFEKLLHKVLLPSERTSGTQTSLHQVLRSLVRRHKQISVIGEPSQGDTGSTSWLVKSPNGDLEEHEAIILKLLMNQTCQAGPKVVHCDVMSEKQVQELFCVEYNRKQTVLSASVVDNGRPWQNMTWVRTQLVARKVENIDTWRELEILSNAL